MLPIFIQENRRGMLIGLVIVLALLGLAAINYQFAAPEREARPEQFIVGLKAADADIVAGLTSRGFIRSPWAFNLVLSVNGWRLRIQPGEYDLSKNMDAWTIARALINKPNMVWVIIPEGLRKEEIADILSRALNWSTDQTRQWITKDTTQKPEYFEGVYFPDTYLIPRADGGPDVASRLISHFNEKIAALAPDFQRENVKWDTALKIASIVQREAGGPDDMPLIAGVIWNRLLKGMKLDIDATIQYARGNTGRGWWTAVTPADKQLDSPYNTYKYGGLPPHPIANPGLEAIAAVLNPAATDCLYYLHDNNRQIHCAATYEEHLKNVRQYLR